MNKEGATLLIPTVATTITYLAIDFYDTQPYVLSLLFSIIYYFVFLKNTFYPTPVTATGSINDSPGLGLKFY